MDGFTSAPADGSAEGAGGGGGDRGAYDPASIGFIERRLAGIHALVGRWDGLVTADRHHRCSCHSAALVMIAVVGRTLDAGAWTSMGVACRASRLLGVCDNHHSQHKSDNHDGTARHF